MSNLEQLRKKQREYNNVHNEGAEGYNPYDARISAELDREMKAFREAKRNEWTIEVTVQRRKEWNELVMSGSLNGANGKFDNCKYLAQVEAQGWNMRHLKQAIERHGL